FRQEIARILSDTTFTTGQACLRNGMVQKLTITVSAYGKTVGEIWAVIQSVREKLALFASQNCLYKVIIENNGDICALMDRDPGTTEVQVLTIY
ncbi:MAG: CamS family sex pheromone protein, partial [Allobaculum sp.]|nr:CamS family sex pheromone protein [Allobaculum sp.]